MRASGLLRERVWGGAKWAARCWPCEGERWAAERARGWLGRSGGVVRARAEGVACGLGRPGREREEWAWAVGLGWGFGFLSFSIFFFSSISNSNKI